ncbi:MAG: hypothetical protein ACKOXO_07665 [Cyanobium sp.]
MAAARGFLPLSAAAQRWPPGDLSRWLSLLLPPSWNDQIAATAASHRRNGSGAMAKDHGGA